MSKKKSGPKKAKNRIRKTLITFFKQNPNQPFNLKQLRAKLDITSSADSIHLENAIGQMLHEKLLEREGHSRVKFTAPVEAYKPITGVIDISKSGSGFVVAENFEQDILIQNRNLLDALPGDTVEVRLTTKSSKKGRPEGVVEKVVKRGRDLYVCVLQVHEKFAFAVPTHRKMNVDFFVPPTQFGGAKDGDLVAIRLINYNPEEKNPVGSVKAVLGKPGDHASEMNAIMLEHNLPAEFPSQVLVAAQKIKDEITDKDISERRDMREVLTFTIDPWDAKDFDDAISYQKLDDDLYEIGVHIADVSHYVKQDGVIDKEAQKRATSVYLVDRVIPMLPERLSNEICSLRPNEDKCCFAAVFQMDSAGVVKDRWFGRTMIHSDRRFTYEEAQERIETGEGDLVDEIKTIDQLAKKLRERRFREGAIAFDREEMRFRLDDKGHPVEIVIKTSKDAHKLIEEFMLLANKEVSENYRRYVKSKTPPPFVYRVHDAPDQKKLEGLQQMARRFGHEVLLVGNPNASKEINRLLSECKDKPEYNMLSVLAIRSMAKAKYTTKNNGHYGLAFPHYTHFTSPIRRYPDVMVHRLLAQYLDGRAETDQAWLDEQCQHSSMMEIEAEEAERDSTKYKMVEYMQQFVGDEFDGIVSGVTEHTLFVELSNKCEGGIRLSNMIDDTYYFDDVNYRVVGRNKGKSYNLGEPIQVRVIQCDLTKRVIELDVLTNVRPRVKPPKGRKKMAAKEPIKGKVTADNVQEIVPEGKVAEEQKVVRSKTAIKKVQERASEREVTEEKKVPRKRLAIKKVQESAPEREVTEEKKATPRKVVEKKSEEKLPESKVSEREIEKKVEEEKVVEQPKIRTIRKRRP